MMRHPLQGVRQIVQFNWPFYIAAAAGSAVGLTASRLPLPRALRLAAGLGGAVGLYFTAVSLLVSWWVYDRSKLMGWDWLKELFPEPPRRWVNIHIGFDESTPDLLRLFPPAHPVVLDLYDPEEMTEPSIRRARALAPPPVPATPASVSRLPLDDGVLDAVFLIFAAHEVRDPASRLRLFEELHRVLKPEGRLLLVEHVRDLANFAAFGPGFMHFMPRSEWLRLARAGGFTIKRELTITPFVRVWLLERMKDEG